MTKLPRFVVVDIRDIIEQIRPHSRVVCIFQLRQRNATEVIPVLSIAHSRIRRNLDRYARRRPAGHGHLQAIVFLVGFPRLQSCNGKIGFYLDG